MASDPSDAMFELIVVIACVVPALVMALGRHKKDLPLDNRKPFRWGYYCGYISIIMGLVAAAANIAVYFSAPPDSTHLVLASLASAFATLGYFVVQRKRVAFVVLTIGSVNPVLWLINSIYIRKRWAELT